MILFNLAGRQNEYLAQRQSLIAQNIANVDMSGYKARDLEKFDATMETAGPSMPLSTTNAMHLQVPSGSSQQAQTIQSGGSQVRESGNDVSLEGEFLKSGEVMRSYSLNTQIVKTFNRMLMSAAKT
jgi:flagellar basal-body rod protein FlgB